MNPVSWTKPTATKLAYRGWYVKDGTNEEIGKHVLDVLNWNKKNADKTQPNLMIMYSWNEFDEGGWLCPTLLCDEKGNVQYNDDGTAKADTGHLDAVKKAIEAFRKYEEHPSVIVDYEGNIVEGSLNDVEQTATPATEVTPSASADTQTPAKKNNSWIIWVCLGAIVVIGATVAVVVTLKKKSAGKTDENEQAAEESNQDGKE